MDGELDSHGSSLEPGSEYPNPYVHVRVVVEPPFGGKCPNCQGEGLDAAHNLATYDRADRAYQQQIGGRAWDQT